MTCKCGSTSFHSLYPGVTSNRLADVVCVKCKTPQKFTNEQEQFKALQQINKTSWFVSKK